MDRYSALRHGLVGVMGICLASACSSARSELPGDGAGGGFSAGGEFSAGTGGFSSSPGGSSSVMGGGGAPSGPSGSGGIFSGGSPTSGTGGGTGVVGGGSGGTPGTMTGTPDGGGPMSAGTCDSMMTSTRLTADLVIPSGQTVCVGPGVTITATADVTVQVAGLLIVEGTAASPAQFIGGGQPSSWHGIVVAAGGNLQLTYGTIRDAQYAIHAMPGSAFNVDHADLGTSFKTAVLESDGKIDHTYFRATVPPTISIASEVTIDDPNGSMTILSASPMVSNSNFIGASPFTDLIRIGGTSSPVFDHVLVQNAHCAFHDYGGTDNSPRVTNSVIEGMSYGVMAYTTKPVFENCIFQNNGYDVGMCTGAAAADVPVLTEDYFATRSVSIDPSCAQIGATATSTATATIPGAGPAGL